GVGGGGAAGGGGGGGEAALVRADARGGAGVSMIERYSRPEMAEVWSDTRRLRRWLDVELAATAAREARGEVPAGVSERIRKAARIDAARMLAIEADVRHDVIAYLSMLAEAVGDDARHLHTRLTSSDLVAPAL